MKEKCCNAFAKWNTQVRSQSKELSTEESVLYYNSCYIIQSKTYNIYLCMYRNIKQNWYNSKK